MSNAQSPIMSHFGAAIAGLGMLHVNGGPSINSAPSDITLVSIRAYGAQDAFKNESLKRINDYTRSARTFHNLNRYPLSQAVHEIVLIAPVAFEDGCAYGLTYLGLCLPRDWHTSLFTSSIRNLKLLPVTLVSL